MTDKNATETAAPIEVAQKSSVAAAAAPVNAWARKPNLRPDPTSSAVVVKPTQAINSPPTPSSSSTTRQANGYPGGNNRRNSKNSLPGHQRQTYNKPSPKFGTQSTIRAEAPTSSTPSSSTAENIMASQKTVGMSYANAAIQKSPSSDSSMAGAIPPPGQAVHFGTLDANSQPQKPSEEFQGNQEQVQRPIPVPGHRQQDIFESIQRVRSAPPKMPEKEKFGVKQPALFQGQNGPPVMQGGPNTLAMNPTAQSFSPQPFMVPQQYMNMSMYTPPNFMPGMPGYGYPSYRPTFAPVPLPHGPEGVMPPVSGPVPRFNTLPATKPPVSDTDKPIFKLPSRKKNILIFKNPETGEAVDFPTKTADQKKESVKEDKKTVTDMLEVQEKLSKIDVPKIEAEIEKPIEEVPLVAVPTIPVEEKVDVSPIKSDTAVLPLTPKKSITVKSVKEPQEQPKKTVSTPKLSPEKKEQASAKEVKFQEPAVVPHIIPEPVSKGVKKHIYTVEFLLGFKHLCTEKPRNMTNVEAVVGENASQHAARRNSKKFDRNSERENVPRPKYSEYPPIGPGKPKPGRPSYGNNKSLLSQSSRRSSGRGSRHSTYDSRDEPKLVKGENSWKSSKELSKTERDEVEILAGKSRGLLNKLTIENFEPVSKQLANLEINNYEELQSFIGTIFEKAIDETKFSGMYAKLCFDLWSAKLPEFSEKYIKEMVDTTKGTTKDMISKRNLFRRNLLALCQKEFEAKSEWSATEETKVHENMTQEELDLHIAETSRRKKLKRRTLGNIKFTGELYKLGMLNEKIIQECIVHLLRNIEHPEEEEMESVCDLMMTVGQKLDSTGHQTRLDECFASFDTLSKHPELQSRIRFKIKDVIDLRKRGWVARERQQNLNIGPMKISDVKKELERQQHVKQRNAAEAIRDAKKKNTGGWIESIKSTRKPERILQKPKAPPKEVKDDSSGSISKSSSTDLKEGQEKRTANMFDALVDADESGTPGANSGDDNLFIEPEKNILEIAQVNEYIKKSLFSDFCKSTNESSDAAFNTFVKIRGMVEEDTVGEITMKAIEKLVNDMSAEGFKLLKDESAKLHVRSFAETLVRIYKYELIPNDVFQEFLENQLIYMPDMTIDVPGLDCCLGFIFGSLVGEGFLEFEFGKDCVKKNVEEMGDFTPRKFTDPPSFAKFFGASMKCMKEYYGEECLRENVKTFIAKEISGKDDLLSSAKSYKNPWWGTDDKKLEAIPDSSIATWLQTFNVLDTVAPNLASLL